MWLHMPIGNSTKPITPFGICSALLVNHLEIFWEIHDAAIRENRLAYTIPILFGQHLPKILQRMNSVMDDERSSITDRYIACLILPQFDFLADPRDTKWIERMCSNGLITRAARLLSDISNYEAQGSDPF